MQETHDQPNAYDRVDSDLLAWIPPDSKFVVDVGCGMGATGTAYKRINPQGFYGGLEINGNAAAIAAARIDRVAVGDAESQQLDALGLEQGQPDCLIYGNVLEHFRDPWATLRRHADWISEDEIVIACIPNIQHWTIIDNLLRGHWNYQEEGLLDRNHLRFFTLDGIHELFTQAKLSILDIRNRSINSEALQAFLRTMSPALSKLGIDQNIFAAKARSINFVVRAGRQERPRKRRLLLQTMIRPPFAGLNDVRIHLPNKYLESIPGVRVVAERNARLHPGRPGERKVFVWQRPILRYPESLEIIRALRRAGYLIVIEFDDDPRRWPEHSKNNFLTFRGAHCLQTSTDRLAKYLYQFNPNIGVFANQIADLPPPPLGSENDEPSTLFMGALNRQDEWREIIPTINKVTKKYGDRLSIAVVHERKLFKSLETKEKYFNETCTYAEYLSLLGKSDIGVLPLLPNEFNSFKSDLKFVEHAAHGVAVLASPTVYEDSIIDGKTGLIFNTPQDLEEGLRRLVENRSFRDRLVGTAYAWVRDNRTLGKHYRKRYHWYMNMLDALPRLDAELLARLPELGESRD